jgi:TadE-like protein
MPNRHPRQHGYRLRFGGRRRRGQSLVELALVAPILVVMLLGAAQVGSIAFGLVSIDTAAREGARAGAVAPNCSLESGFTSGCTTGSLWYAAPGTTSHQCNAGDFSANPICEAVLNSAGTLSASLFTTNPCASAQQACVTITLIPPTGLLSTQVRPQTAHLDASSCNGANATVTGVVSGMPSGQTATITAITGETQPTDTSGNFSICVKANGGTTSQTLTAQVGSASCGGYSGSVGPFPVSPGATVTENITVTAEGTCPTATPTPTPTPATCNNQQATVTGVVSTLPSGQLATITATTGETATTDSVGNYTICVKANGGTNSQTLTAQVGSPVCGGWTGSVGPFAVTGGGSNPNENITLTAGSACPTATPVTGPGATCAPEAIPNLDTYFVQVTVTYPSPIFVPFIGGIFQSQPGFRVISTTVTDAIEPCTLTQGQ